ncbi:hypothetical protein PoB_007646000 [Plakobranchus ocellatus]|uniref:PiggyBac transposable element-derived protein 4 C-terminal zinc-ribbon domain-containing protein n=1 Tax=Plakobranchus ocellatus TaxID=259542 RepID=A0AAV4E150_9GAST|nr:hypothetical protein PoB_007646000 [Plakobranchus ocellatus]
MSRPPKVGRPFKSPCPSPSLGRPDANGGIKKRRKGNFSVSDAVRLQELYRAERGRCEVCSSHGVQSRPHSKCRMCNVFPCSNEKKTASWSSMESLLTRD